mmetsp:Transcript_24403/g.39314  ORF Transcript_24403/g.39314 Transcript_24403/m.39314 type:complete len:298 (-) Transcript_24403:233-1126(-)
MGAHRALVQHAQVLVKRLFRRLVRRVRRHVRVFLGNANHLVHLRDTAQHLRINLTRHSRVRFFSMLQSLLILHFPNFLQPLLLKTAGLLQRNCVLRVVLHPLRYLDRLLAFVHANKFAPVILDDHRRRKIDLILQFRVSFLGFVQFLTAFCNLDFFALLKLGTFAFGHKHFLASCSRHTRRHVHNTRVLNEIVCYEAAVCMHRVRNSLSEQRRHRERRTAAQLRFNKRSQIVLARQNLCASHALLIKVARNLSVVRHSYAVQPIHHLNLVHMRQFARTCAHLATNLGHDTLVNAELR